MNKVQALKSVLELEQPTTSRDVLIGLLCTITDCSWSDTVVQLLKFDSMLFNLLTLTDEDKIKEYSLLLLKLYVFIDEVHSLPFLNQEVFKEGRILSIKSYAKYLELRRICLDTYMTTTYNKKY
jgi:hypothetical protein